MKVYKNMHYLNYNLFDNPNQNIYLDFETNWSCNLQDFQNAKKYFSQGCQTNPGALPMLMQMLVNTNLFMISVKYYYVGIWISVCNIACY